MHGNLNKNLVLIGFYLCLHFNCCLPIHSEDNHFINDPDSHVYKCLGRLHDTGETSVEIPGQFMSDNVTRSFSLKRKELNCKKGRFKVLFELGDSSKESRTSVFPTAKVLKTDGKSRKTMSYSDPTIKIMRHGAYLKILNDFFHPVEYCFDQIDSSELSIFVCYPECYGQRPCITKCCAQDEVWDVRNKNCRKAQAINVDKTGKTDSTNNNVNNITTNENNVTTTFTNGTGNQKAIGTNTETSIWTPWLFSRSVDSCVKKVTAYHRQQLSVHFQQRLPDCDPSEYQLIPLRKIHNHAFQRFRVLWTGAVIMRDKKGNWSEFTPGRFCVDGMVNFGPKSGPDADYSGAFEDQVVLACPDQVPLSVQKKPIPLRYAVMLLVSAGILLLTTLISIMLWDRQSVYEWTISCEVISMFFMILFVGIAHTVARRPEKSDFGSAHCVFIGACSHFFWLATFCWLFIINFEIWWNFRSLVQLRQSRKWFRFSIYQLVGWGCPLVVVGVGFLLDRVWGLQNEDLDCANLIVPNYGQLNCYISKQAQGPYLFYPIGVVLGCNLIFYLLTVCKMWGYQKKSQAIIQYRSRGQTQPILIFAKLFIVMGVSWIFEIVSWAITASEADKIPLYWVIFDIVTLFQAISIFVIFIWKKQVLSKLWYKYPSLQGILGPLTRIPGCGLMPTNERDRFASLHNPSPNKLPRENPAVTMARHMAAVQRTQARGASGSGDISVNGGDSNITTSFNGPTISPARASAEQLALSSV